MSVPSWHAVRATHFRWLSVLSAFLLLVGFLALGPTPRAAAYEIATGAWTTPVTGATDTSTLTMPSGVVVTATTTGYTDITGTSTIGARGFSASNYSPSTLTTNDSALAITVNAQPCSVTGVGTCTNLGVLTLSFSQPVRDPIIHLAGLGAAVGNGTNQSDFHAILDLQTSGLSLTQVGTNGVLTVSGTRITATNDSTGTSCLTNVLGSGFFNTAVNAACGSVQVTGVMSSVSFAMGTIWVKNASASAATFLTSAGDAIVATVTLPQDFSDAPTSYNGTQAPAHVLSDLTLGSTVDADNQNSRNPTSAPWAAQAATGDDTTGVDDEDAFTTLPDVVAQSGATYSLTVPISGLSKSATLCGWVDFNRNGTFDTGERQCATPAAGATSATLTWTIPSTVSIGLTDARFRLGYTSSQVMSPTGLADSGEVEDYAVSILPRPQIILTKTTTGATGGPFTYTLTNTTQAGGTVTTTSAGTAVQVDGDTGTSGTQAFTASTVNTAVTIAEGALAGWAVTGATCTTATGTTVGSLAGTTYTIPATAVVPGAVITCAFTNAKPGVSLTKTNGGIIDLDGNGPDAGDAVQYSFLVQNTGQTTLTGITVNDPKAGTVSCPSTTLSPGGSVTCTVTYTLTQADVTSGSVVNTATVTANPPSGPVLTATSSNTLTIAPNPKLTLSKTAGTPTGNTAGSTVTYTFVVTNTGNLPLTAVAVSDPTVGPVTCPVTSLDPGASTTCTKTYALTQADVDAGTLVNVATATGLPPAGAPVTSTSTATIYIARTATISLTKTAGTPSGVTAGSTLGYSFLVTNTGNVTLTSISIADTLVPSYTCPTTTLLPGASTTCTGTHTLTQAEIDAGTILNQATASGVPPSGMSAPTSYAQTTTPLVRTPAITLDKQYSGMSGQTAGSTISYSFVVTNTGNVSLTGLWLLDAKVTSTSCPSTSLAVGASLTCTGTYTLTQADVDAGHVANSATATAYGPNGQATQASDTVDTTVTPGSAIALVKSAGTPTGSTIAYSFLVTNTGNVTLTGIGVTDPKVGPVSCPVSTLAPGASTTCTKTYTLTQADIDSGTVVNTATASGRSPTNVLVQATSSTSSTITRSPAFTFDKQAGSLSGTTAGSTLAYTFVVTNTGNVTLSSLSVSDPVAGSVTCPDTQLAPGATTTCTATHVLTQTEVDSGHVANTATATMAPPAGLGQLTRSDSTDTPIQVTPAISLVKQAGAPTGTTTGSTITYTFLVTNTGNVTLTAVAVADANLPSVTCPQTTLLPGASTTCSGVYALTQADVDAGSVTNSATATGTPPSGATPTAQDSTTTTLTRSPAITLTKTAGAPSGTTAGSTIAYSFVVTNTGNVTLTDVGVSDPKAGPVTCPDSTLAPGSSTTCTKPYVLTQTDVDAGQVDNTATASGTPPAGGPVTASSSTSTAIPASPAITLTKSAGAPSGTTAGSTIAYSFLLANTGNVTLTSVGVSDPTLAPVTCPVSQLAPGESTTCSKTYTLTQADVDAGTVDNTATGVGIPPTGAAVVSTSSVTTPITRSPAITFDKQAAAPTGTTAGSTIAYTFLVTNTGNVSLTAVGITDPTAGAISCPATSLAPGATLTCAATYALTQTDVDAGHVANTATATATPPTGSPLTAQDSTDTAIPSGPELTLTKTGGAPSGSTPGSTIDYTFLVTNTGNVTLTGLAVTDPLTGPVSCPVTQLAPGASTTCTATYAISQSDIDAGAVDNTAVAVGTPPSGATVSATGSAHTAISTAPAITLVKSAAAPSGNTAGSTIAYSFLVTNTGNVTLTGVTVADPTAAPVSCPPGTLAPGASTTCTATYTLTQADADAGRVTNTATASATPPTGDPVSATDSVSTLITATPSVTLVKSGVPSGSTAGSSIAYSFLVTNTGSVTLTSVVIADDRVSGVDCPETTLAPGASTTCTATYLLTQADVNSGHVTNSATVTANPPTGPPVTAADSVTTPIPASPSVLLDKRAGTPSSHQAGAVVPYSFGVTNTGNVTLTGLTVVDPLVGAVSCPVTTLQPGISTTCTGSHVLTQAEIDAGAVVNVAHATANPPIGSPVTSYDTALIAIPAEPALVLDKQAAPPTGMTVGATIAYTFVVTNTGNVTLGVSVADPLVGPVACLASTLDPGASTTCAASYTLTQNDVDAGHVANTAVATGTPPSGLPVTASDSTDSVVTSSPSVTLVKTAGTPSGTTAGSTIDYTFVVTNTGNVTLRDVTVTDALVGTVGCPESQLAPGATTTCTATYALTQADVDAGQVTNSASASGTPPTGPQVTATDAVTTVVPASPSIALDKRAGAPTGILAGSTITYAFDVTNTGNVTLSSVAVSDPVAGTVTCPVGTLAPGEHTTCSAVYVLTQADVDSGHRANTATASGTPPTGSPVTAQDSTDSTLVGAPAITLTKTAGAPTGQAAGATISYTFVVANTGNLTLSSVGVSDPKVGTVTCPATQLAPGESTTCTTPYTITQADVDAGTVDNSATASGTPPTGPAVQSTDTTSTPIIASPGLTLVKTAGAASGTTASSTIPYSFVVTNTGNVTLTGVGLTDPLVGTVTCPVDTLAPGTHTTCTGTYALTQADVDSGHVANSATATATPPTGSPVSASDAVDTVIPSQPSITLVKSAGAPSGNAAGSTIDYSFVVTNTGNVSLSAVTVDDPTVGPVTCPFTYLAPGASATCTATYALTQADVDAGLVHNTATASATPPAGDPVTASDAVDSPIVASPSVTLDKQASAPSGTTAGSTISYTFVVTNTGNVTLDHVTVDDALVGHVSCPVAPVAPDATATCTATYTLTQADVDAGHVDNTATVVADPPSGDPVTATDSVQVLIPAAPSVSLDKTASAPSGTTAGSTVDYTFLVTNTGNVTLSAVAVEDPMLPAVDCPAAQLAPGAQMTCTATYALTQADVDGGHVLNRATVSADPPAGDPVTAADSVDVTIPAAPSVTLDKATVGPASQTPGAIVPYTFLVTNTGNVTLSGVTVTDPLVGAVSCPATSLVPGTTTTCTAEYVLTQADVDAGRVTNSATVSADPPAGDPVTASDSVVLPITASPAVAIDKQAGTPSAAAVGGTIPYTFLVQNTGNVTLHAVVITDPRVGPVSCPVTTLAAGAATICNASYTLSQVDVDSGHVANTAGVTGTSPTGVVVAASDSVDTPILASPAITLDKQAGTPTGTAAGATIAYSFVVSNTGNVTITSLVVSDPKLGTVACPVTQLAPGATTTCTASYTLTQADVDAGHVANTATASATPPSGGAVSATDSTDTTIAASPRITLDKQASAPTGTSAGATIDYAFLVHNTGNVTLTGVAVSDATVGAVTCPTTTLAPGASTTCTATYVLTQADIDAGHRANTATVSGHPPVGAPVTATDQTDTLLPALPVLALDKQAGPPSGFVAGATIAYTFQATNAGNVTLHLLSVSDPRVGSVSCPVTTLAPGQQTTCTATYAITQADVDAGHVPNAATALALTPAGSSVTSSDGTDTLLPPSPGVTLDKQATPPTTVAAGSTVAYQFVVTNTGNVTLSGVTVADPRVGSVTCPLTSLAPGTHTTCTATYTLTQADVDAGHVANEATVTAVTPAGPTVQAADSVDLPLAAAPSIVLDKQAGALSGATAGSTIPYDFVVTNTGNVTLTGVVISDAILGSVSCPETALAPGETTTCSATYTLTQADVDAGHIANTASVSATPPAGGTTSASDSTDTAIAATPSLTLDKQAGPPSGATAGSVVPYSFVVTNTGNVTLTSLEIADARVAAVSCPLTTLAPGASTTCTGLSTLTQADVDAGHVLNTAIATAAPPAGDPVTATDSVDTTIPASPGIAFDKQAGAMTGHAAGATLPYTFVVTNTGNVTLSGITVSDPTLGPVSCPVSTLAPLASTSCTATYTLTQDDVDAGHVANTAGVTATPPVGDPVTASDSTDVPVETTSGIDLVKRVVSVSGAAAGSQIAYAFDVTNIGDVTLSGISVADPKVGAVSCPVTTLAPTETTTCTASYVLTQADVDAGHVANTATVTSQDPVSATVSHFDTVDTLVPASPSLSFDKQAGTATGRTASSTIPYTFVVTNTGNVTLTGLTVTDPKVGAVSCPTTTLAPGVQTTCTATYTLTQADVNAGHVANTATATATPPFGGTVSGTDSTDTAIPATPSLTLDKQAAAPSGTTAGSTIAYSFVVTNTGNVTLHGVGVADPTAGAVTCPVTTLAPGARTTCTATYVLTQADIDAGHVANTATATGLPPIGSAVSATDSVDSPLTRSPAVTLDKQAGAPSGQYAGAVIAYSFVVTNTGNVTLTAISVADATVGAVSCPTTTLAPTASTTCTASYTVTQADLDRGTVDNTATVSATPPAGGPVTASDSTTTTFVLTPGLLLDKRAGTPSAMTAGATIAYTFTAYNTGNVTLHLLQVVDPIVGSVYCPATTIAPGGSVTCTATYVVGQADVDAGHVPNSALASALPPSGPAVTASGSADTTITASPGVTLDKQAGAPSAEAAGGHIVYSFVVTNTGNVTLHGVVVDDPTVGPVSCPTTTLAPGVYTTCLATYVLTQTDVDAGHVANVATVSATPPAGDAVTSTDTTDVTIAPDPSLTLTKTAGPHGATAGSTIPYSFAVTNTGNVTLTAVAVADATVGAVSCPAGSLAPGDSTTCTASYTLTQADVDAGLVTNTATASATPPSGPAVSASDTIVTTITPDPQVGLVKHAGVPTGNTASSSISYTFDVTNLGNVTLHAVAVADPLVGAVSCPATVLAPGAHTTCTATYVLTQADVDAGHIANHATATGTSPGGVAVHDDDTTDTTVVAEPGIDLVKSAGAASGDTATSTIPYSFLVTNTGNVTLHAVAVADALVGPVSCPASDVVPGGQVTCTATYTLTQADVDAAQVHNTATASATPPLGGAVSASDSVTTPVPAAPSITLTKTAGTATGATAGSTVPYSFVVTNTGNVTLTAVSVTDAKVPTVTCPPAPLAPGSQTTCTGTYTLTQADVDAGGVENTATAAATPPSGAPVSAQDSVVTTIPATPGVHLLKQAGTASGNTAGSSIPYTFVVTNTGNVTLVGLAVSDPKVGLVSCPATTLAPAAQLTCTATYLVTQADVDAGVVENTATVSANPPSGAAITSSSTADATIPAAPRLGVTKTAGLASGDTAGAVIPYTVVVTNLGNVTLSAITASDPLLADLVCTPTAALAPGDSMSCTGTYVLTQADVDAGHVTNTATATALPPTGAPVSGTDTVVTPVAAAPALTVLKTGLLSGETAGSPVTYTFAVTNTGNVSLHAITVSDPLAGPVTCPPVSVAPGATLTCSATYVLTQTDVDLGSVTNTATASGTAPGGQTAQAQDTVTTPIAAAPHVTIVKRAGAASGNTATSTIPYTFVVTNDGNVTLTGVTVLDPKAGTVSCPQTTLAPNAQGTCTATYALTQADADAGHVANTATVTATPPAGAPVEATDTIDTPVPPTPALTFVKQAGSPSGDVAGSTIAYSFVVTNTGSVTLQNIVVTDPLVAVSCPVEVLAPLASTMCTATYVLTQADVDAGVVVNEASVTAMPSVGVPVGGSDSTQTVIAPRPELTLAKTAGEPSGTGAGSTIAYSFLVTNTGNVTLDHVVVTDPLVGPVDCPVGVLAPLASTTCTASYVLTQADIDAGHVQNSAEAFGNPPAGDPADTADDATATDTVDTMLVEDPSVTLVKTAGEPSGMYAGGTIAYTFLVTNTGNVTLRDVVVTDPLVGAVSCPTTTLAPGAATTCTGTYGLVQADLDAGSVTNHATVSAMSPFEAVVSADGTATSLLARHAAVAFSKHADTAGPVAAGDQVTFSFQVTNTGNVTLSSIVVSDPMVGAVTCPATDLAPGETILCSAAAYTVTAADAARGSILNTAVVSVLGAELDADLVTLTASDSVSITTTRPLPNTGSPVGVGPLAASVVILCLGVALTIAGRRRRTYDATA